jgi:hypothetical protein
LRIRTHPLIYEINTWAWLTALSRRYGRPVTLGSIPAEAYDALAEWGFDAIWLMGVWQRSPAARDLARRPMIVNEYQGALPDLKPEDIVGSAYAIHAYEVDSYIGGSEGLAACRAELTGRGLRLLLDYVPNHVAVDHPWLTAHPDALLHGSVSALASDPITFFQGPHGDVVAHGRDPYFPAWIDTAQINAFSTVARDLARETLAHIAAQCDGVRCDMAMLLLNRIFANTWRDYAGPTPQTEYWKELISATKATYPDFIFSAEAYWGTEPELLALGFDFTYDKGFYDLLRGGNMDGVRAALSQPVETQAQMARFTENHDEARAVNAFGAQRSLAAAAITLLAPGAHLIHEGQLSGWRVKIPVQLARRLEEAADVIIEPFYQLLLSEATLPIYHAGEFKLLAGVSSLPGSIVAFSWAIDGEWRIIIVNYSDHAEQASLAIPDAFCPAGFKPVHEVFSNASSTIIDDEIAGVILEVQLPPFGVQVWKPR